MSRNITRVLLSIASLVLLAYSQNVAQDANDLLPDEDGGQVRVVRADSSASTVSGKETATIHAPKQVSMFFGGTWAEDGNRTREAQLTNLLTFAGSAKQQEMSKSGVRAVDSRNSFTEDFTDMRLHPPLTDLGIQRQIQTWISTGAMQAPKANSVYVIYLGQGVRSMLRDKVGGQDYLGYYSLVHLDVGTIVYAVVPYDADTARMQQTASRLLMEAAIDPAAAKRGS
jgi:hypothetical protein